VVEFTEITETLLKIKSGKLSEELGLDDLNHHHLYGEEQEDYQEDEEVVDN
jgi:hypothetical protein